MREVGEPTPGAWSWMHEDCCTAHTQEVTPFSGRVRGNAQQHLRRCRKPGGLRFWRNKVSDATPEA